MKDTELRSQVTPDADPYLAAYRAGERERTMRQRLAADGDVSPDYFQNFDTFASERLRPDVDWRECDSHLQAVLGRKGTATATAHNLAAGPDARDSHGRSVEDWRRERQRAQREVSMLEKLGEPVPDDLRAQAEEPDLGEAVADMAAAMRSRSRGAWIAAKAGLPT